MDKEIKSFDLSIKDSGEEKGSVEAVFSVYNNQDSDGDVVLPGAVKSGFKDNQVPMVFAHKWDQPIGKGTITEGEDSAVFKGSFFMETEAGKEAYNLVKSMGDLQQWSFGFRVNDSEMGKLKKDGEDEADVRYLKDLTVYEVSPVLVGANQETYTLAIKTGEDTVYEKKETKTEEKAALEQDMFETVGEAVARAKELGCDGSHVHEVDGKEVYMPCATHEDYEKIIAEKQAEPEEEEEKDSECCGGCKSDEKGVLGHDSFAKAEPEEEGEEEKAYHSCDYGKTGKCAKEGKKEEEVSESDSSMSGKRFSEEIKDVLAALEDLIVRTKAIGLLREKDGRKLSDKATQALRAVQEDLNDAWEELDEVISQVGTMPEVEEEMEAITEEEATEVEAPEEVSEDVEIEEAEVEVVEEVEESTEEVEEEVVDDEIDEVILQAQVNLTESLIAEQELEEN